MDLLEKLKAKLEQPVKLSETELVKFEEVFAEIETWLSTTKSKVVELDREEAYRQVNVLTRQISDTQKLFEDPAHTIKKIIENKPLNLIEPGPKPEPRPQTQLNERGTRPVNLDGAIDLVIPNDPERFPAGGQKPTAEQFKLWVESLPETSRDIALTKLDCVRQFEELGSDIICPECTPAAFVQCIQDNDPSYSDSTTEFMARQLQS